MTHIQTWLKYHQDKHSVNTIVLQFDLVTWFFYEKCCLQNINRADDKAGGAQLTKRCDKESYITKDDTVDVN